MFGRRLYLVCSFLLVLSSFVPSPFYSLDDSQDRLRMLQTIPTIYCTVIAKYQITVQWQIISIKRIIPKATVAQIIVSRLYDNPILFRTFTVLHTD